jgi:hypothetical protein
MEFRHLRSVGHLAFRDRDKAIRFGDSFPPYLDKATISACDGASAPVLHGHLFSSTHEDSYKHFAIKHLATPSGRDALGMRLVTN